MHDSLPVIEKLKEQNAELLELVRQALPFVFTTKAQHDTLVSKSKSKWLSEARRYGVGVDANTN